MLNLSYLVMPKKLSMYSMTLSTLSKAQWPNPSMPYSQPRGKAGLKTMSYPL